MWETIIGGGISALGSLIGGRKSASSANRVLNFQRDQFNDMMDQTVQRRVADAKKAGIHPLAALGMSPGAGPTITGAGVGAEGRAIAEAGSAIGGAIAQRKAHVAQMRNIESSTKLNEAQAGYWNSLTSRQAETSPGTDGGALDALAIDQFNDVVPRQQYGPPVKRPEQSPGVAQVEEPLWTKARNKDGRSVDVVNPNIGAEELNLLLVPMGIARHMVTDFLEWTAQFRPETPYVKGATFPELKEMVSEYLKKRWKAGKPYRSVPRSEYLLDVGRRK